MENSPILTPKTSIPECAHDQEQEDRRRWAYSQVADAYNQLREWYADLGKKRGKWWQKSFRQILASEHVGMVEMNLERLIHAVVNGQTQDVRGSSAIKLMEGCAYLLRYVAGKAKIEVIVGGGVGAASEAKIEAASAEQEEGEVF